MSVCFFVNSDQAGTSTSTEGANETEGASPEDSSCVDPIQSNLHKFWTKVSDDIEKITADDFKTQALPLARIKKIMKLDDEVKMISAEAPLLFAKAAEIFIHELTLRAWSHTEDNKRRTLQRNDIAMAISRSDQFDFLIDIVPRHESMVTNTNKPKKDATPQRTIISTINQSQPTTSAIQTTGAQPQLVLQPYTQIVQPPQTSSSPAVASTNTQQPLVLHQVMANNELQQMPLQLTQAQLNMIRFQMQNNPNQPIIIQAQPQQNQQIIQVSSQAQQPQVYVQVANTQDTDS